MLYIQSGIQRSSSSIEYCNCICSVTVALESSSLLASDYLPIHEISYSMERFLSMKQGIDTLIPALMADVNVKFVANKISKWLLDGIIYACQSYKRVPDFWHVFMINLKRLHCLVGKHFKFIL